MKTMEKKERDRKTGIDIVGHAPWGTHLCLFYKDKQDLIDVLVPYFKAGLQNNEFCMWVTSKPLNAQEANSALRQAVQNLDAYINRGQIEILDYTQWYTESGKFEADKVLQGWVTKHDQALKRGFDGLRLSGNTFWLEKDVWREFINYEATVNDVIGKYRMLAVCTYSLERCGASEVIDVVSTHQFALIRREDEWQIIESTKHKNAEEALQASESKYRTLLESLPQKIFLKDRNSVYLSCNDNYAGDLKIEAEQIAGRTDYEFYPKELAEKYRADDQRIMQSGQVENIEEKYLLHGQEVSVQTVKTPVKDDHGNVSGILGIFWDITERKMMEESLLRSEERFRLAAGCCTNLIYEWDIGNRIEWFGKIDELLCYAPGELPRTLEAWTNSIHPDDRDRVTAAINNHLEKNELYDIEYRIRKKDGTYNCWLARGTAVRDKNGNPYRWVGVVSDITERKKAEEALKESKERLELALSAASMGTWRWNIKTDQDTRDANFNSMLGLKAAESTQSVKDFIQYVHPDDRAVVDEEIKRAIRERDIYRIEFRIVRPDGTIYWLSDRGKIYYDQKNEPAYMTGAVFNITERKQMEETLRQSEARYKALFAGAPEGILVADLQTKQFRYANPAMCGMFGYTEEEFLRIGVADLHPKESLDHVLAEFEAQVRGEKVLSPDLPCLRKDGTLFYANISGIIMVLDARKCSVGFFTDITERKEAEKAFEKLNKDLELAVLNLGRSNKELQDFAYVVSHDLKAPLRGIKTLAQWITTDYADKIDENGRGQLNLLLSRADRMHNLIDGILQYSRVGRVQEEKVQVNLNELVAEAIDMIAPPENIVVSIENELPVIECERTRIAQVFQNLLSNAVKFMDKPEGQVRIGCAAEDGWWKFSVTDNGPGIEEKYFEKIFQLFQTLSPRDEVESTGVGLTVAKKIVELYGGKIWVQSKVGQGSTFLFTLPKQQVRIENAELQASIVG